MNFIKLANIEIFFLPALDSASDLTFSSRNNYYIIPVKIVKSGVPLLNRISNPGTTLQSEKLTYGSLNERYLEAQNKVSNMTSKAELVNYPMIIDINKRILNYLSYLQDEGDNSTVKQFLQISIEPYNSCQNNFYSNLMRMSEYFSQHYGQDGGAF